MPIGPRNRIDVTQLFPARQDGLITVTFYVQGHGEGDVRVGILNAAQEELEYHQHHQHEGGNFATFTFPIRKHEIAKFEYNKGAQDHRALFVAL